MLIDKRV